MQLSNILNTDASCCHWEGHDFFKELMPYKEASSRQVLLMWSDILNAKDFTLPKGVDFYIDDPAYLLHNVFYKLTKRDPRNFLTIQDRFRKEFNDGHLHVGIHIRGGDVITTDAGKEIHEFAFYRDSIQLVEAEYGKRVHYHVCTDDPTFDTYKSTIEYLTANNFKFDLGSVDDLYSDFSTLCECDILILSSSTFGVCAGFIGKKNKKIIHSKKWISRNLNHTPWNNTTSPDTRKWHKSFDNFWIDLYNGGNHFYKLWKTI